MKGLNLNTILSKGLDSLLTLFLISFITFILIRLLPGDPVLLMLGEKGADPDIYRQMKEQLGLHLPLYKQYFLYFGDLIQGNFGQSLITKASVFKEFTSHFTATLELSFLALIIACIGGVSLGVMSAFYEGKWPDKVCSLISLTGYSMPIFWWGLLMIIFLSVNLGWFPVSGRVSFYFDVPQVTGLYLIDSFFAEEPLPAFFSTLKHLFLPSFVLATVPLALINRMTRALMIENLKKDFIRTARSKGISEASILFKHALRNALIPLVTSIGLMGGTLLTGAILTETIFSWPGIGQWLVKALLARDYPIIQSGVLIIASMIVFINLFIDSIYVLLNPNLNKEGGS